MSKKDTVKVLNNLIQTSEDGKKGFIEASEEAANADLKVIFRKRSVACDAAVVELQQLVGYLGATPEDSGTIAGAVLRGWAKVKTATSDPDIAMLEIVECAEDKAKTNYAKALTATLPTRVRIVVQRQHDDVIRNHELIRELRNRYQKAAEKSAKG